MFFNKAERPRGVCMIQYNQLFSLAPPASSCGLGGIPICRWSFMGPYIIRLDPASLPAHPKAYFQPLPGNWGWNTTLYLKTVMSWSWVQIMNSNPFFFPLIPSGLWYSGVKLKVAQLHLRFMFIVILWRKALLYFRKSTEGQSFRCVSRDLKRVGVGGAHMSPGE